ncbi:hypothetical protein ACFSHQ_25295 [Gemmobacter lanyuensis]
MTVLDSIARRGEVTIRDLSKSFTLNGRRLDVLRGIDLHVPGARSLPSSALRAAARPRCCGSWRGLRNPIGAMC